MPVDKIKKGDIPGKTRNRSSPLKTVEEWKDVQAVLAAGLKPQEAVRVTLSPATLRLLTVTIKGKKVALKEPEKKFANLLRAHIRKLNLPYDVWNQSEPGGQKVTYVVGR